MTNEKATIDENIQMSTHPEIIKFTAEESQEIAVQYYDPIPVEVIIYRINTRAPKIGVAINIPDLISAYNCLIHFHKRPAIFVHV